MSSKEDSNGKTTSKDDQQPDLDKLAARLESLDLEAEYAKNRTVFGAILRGEETADFIYQDEQVVAFHDHLPVAPVHFLIIPRKTIRQIEHVTDGDEQLLGHMVLVATKLAKKLGLTLGYRLIINNGWHGHQTVFHLHLHVIGGRKLIYPYA